VTERELLVNTGFLLLQLCYTTGSSFSKLKSRFPSREDLAQRLIPD
jgi:hypothetical protein